MGFSKFRLSLQRQTASIYRQARQNWADILLVVIIAVVASFTSLQGAQMLSPVLFDERAGDVWFESDLPRWFANMTDRESNYYRAKVHPLFPLIAFSLVSVLNNTLSIEKVTAVRIVIALVAALWSSALFILFRLIGCHRFDAMLFNALAAISAAAMFWFVVPETYSFGSLTILLALGIAALAQYQNLSPWWYVVISALTLSFTVTNWMVGIIATIVSHPWKYSLRITLNGFCLVIALWCIEKLIFPSVGFPFASREEKNFLFMSEAGGLVHIFPSFISHTVVMPAIKIINDRYPPPHWSMMITQYSSPGSGSMWGAIAVLLWSALLGLGLWALFSIKQHLKLRIVLGFSLLGQLVLCAVYGNETFLYSLHVVPLLVVTAALSMLTRARPIGLVLAGMLVISAAVNNGLEFHKAMEFVHSLALTN